LALKKIIPLLGLSLISAAAPAEKQEPTKEKEALLSLGAGYTNITKSHNRRLLFQLEYKWKPIVAELRPQAGAFVTVQRSAYFYGGFAYDLLLGEKVVLTPSLSVGVYMRGKGKDLGFPINFRSAIELAYRFDNKARLGAVLYHLSHAHMAHRNPGINILAVFYSIPL
jgi:lipid A 3-O-deacylase